MTKITESGVIGGDGKLRMPMDRLRNFFTANKGHRVIVSFEAVEQGSTEAQRAYYYKYIVPTIQKALAEIGERKSDRQVDKWIRGECPFIFEKYHPAASAIEMSIDTVTGEVTQREVEQVGYTEIRGIKDLSKREMSDFIDWIAQMAAEYLQVYIESSETI